MQLNLRHVVAMGCIAGIFLLEGCDKQQQASAPEASQTVSAPAPAASASTGEVTVEMIIAKDGDTAPASKFPADVPKLVAFFKSQGSKPGDKFKGVWIAEDVGNAAPKETKIDEAMLAADKENYFGGVSLSKPTNGWPVGAYRAEIYVNDQLKSTAKFTIEAKE